MVKSAKAIDTVPFYSIFIVAHQGNGAAYIYFMRFLWMGWIVWFAASAVFKRGLWWFGLVVCFGCNSINKLNQLMCGIKIFFIRVLSFMAWSGTHIGRETLDNPIWMAHTCLRCLGIRYGIETTSKCMIRLLSVCFGNKLKTNNSMDSWIIHSRSIIKTIGPMYINKKSICNHSKMKKMIR